MLERIELHSGAKVWSNDELEFFSEELWQTAAMYEMELRCEKKGVDYERQMIRMKTMKQMDFTKNRAAFYMEALEQAFTEMKLRYNNEINTL
jgi:hypothetical protein